MRISDWSSDVCSSDLHGLDDGTQGSLGRNAGAGDTPFAIFPGYGEWRCRAVPGTHRAQGDTADRLSPRHRDRRTDALPRAAIRGQLCPGRSEEHTSELQSLMRISYAVFCMKKKTIHIQSTTATTLS